MLILIILLIVITITLLSLGIMPIILNKLKYWQEKKEKVITKELDKMFYDKNPKRIVQLYFILPFLLAILGFLFTKSLLFIFIGAVLGLFIPNLILKLRDAQYKQKFNQQILDAIMILSSCMKSGLSFLQALEVLTEEMSPPMSWEIGIVIRENKMGMTLEESLKHLNEKMQMEELTLLINSILVARETGGDLTKVLSRLSTTIRDNRKLKESIKTLTLQGRLQGIIMSALPFLFVWWVLTFNRSHFDIMFQSQIGRMLLFLAVFLQVVGMILIKKFSTINI